MIPSYDALHRHCWVASQATSNHITYPPLHSSGWKQPDQDILFINWDSENNVGQIRARVALFRKGCGCKTACHTARCKCNKQDITVVQFEDVMAAITYFWKLLTSRIVVTFMRHLTAIPRRVTSRKNYE